MKKIIAIALIIALPAWLAGCSVDEAELGKAGSIERILPAIDALVPSDAVVEKVAGDFRFIEGPVWLAGQPGSLLFSDIPGNAVYRWTEGKGTEVYLQPVLAEDANTGAVGGANGLALDSEGRLILCEHGNRRVARLEGDGSRTTLADRYDGKRLNSPNDIVFHASGAAFFTDPPYGLPGGDDNPGKEQAHNGVYRLDADGTVTLVADSLTRPNGIGLSPDQRTLYVANSDYPPRRFWMAYPVRDDLSLGEGSVFFDANEMEAPGLADGFALDQQGNMYTSGPGGVLVIDPDGRHLGTIRLDEIASNASWGDDGKTLYITAHTGLYRIKLSVGG